MSPHKVSLQIINYTHVQCIQHQQHAAYALLFYKSLLLLCWVLYFSTIFFSVTLYLYINFFLSNERKCKHTLTRHAGNWYQYICKYELPSEICLHEIWILFRINVNSFLRWGLLVNDLSSVSHAKAYVVVRTCIHVLSKKEFYKF